MIEFSAAVPARKHLDLTPLVDVIFQLLIFFVLTSAWTSGIPLTLPRADSATPQARTTVTVSIDAGGTVHLDARSVPVEDLQRLLALEIARHDDPIVAVQADVTAAFGSFVRVVDVCRALGIDDLVLLTGASDPEGVAP